jgi:hypothetical protein
MTDYALRSSFAGQAQVHFDMVCASKREAQRERDIARREVDRLREWMFWACMELDDAADAIGPVPDDLAERVLRSVEKKLNAAITTTTAFPSKEPR